MGPLLELGPERDVGVYRVAELRRMAASAAGCRLARQDFGLVGDNRVVCYRVCLYRREHVFERFALLRNVVSLF